MNKDLLEKSQEEYLRQLNIYLTLNKKPKIDKTIIEMLIDKYLEDNLHDK